MTPRGHHDVTIAHVIELDRDVLAERNRPRDQRLRTRRRLARRHSGRDAILIAAVFAVGDAVAAILVRDATEPVSAREFAVETRHIGLQLVIVILALADRVADPESRDATFALPADELELLVAGESRHVFVAGIGAVGMAVVDAVARDASTAGDAFVLGEVMALELCCFVTIIATIAFTVHHHMT